ncbi:HK97 gp10 family phage protein [Facklamia lactis]|uniref:HK97 gp10 family phage protein n=1 Tax=Facklamia lactis TaxID=2749967 RepID=UPI0018CEAF41|nr:HK97 gp10 family phage protein [Facklamia lactis]MBG9980445.1 HK97 gp10 family phage protein [Facklamia lactis]
MKKIAIDQLADEIMAGLEEYADLATESVKQVVKKSGQTVRKEIKTNAPKDTTAYQKSWSVKTERETSTQLHLIVHSRNRYQLAHLLEHGHAKRGGGRVKGQPHILPAQEVGIKQLESDIEKELKR